MQRRILVIRFGSLGDVILTSPAVLNLKLAYPGAELVFLTKARFRPIVELFNGVDGVVTIPDRASARELTRTAYDLDRQGFDIVVDLHGNMRSWFTRSIVSADFKPVYPKRRLERWRVTRREKSLPENYPHTIDLYNDTLNQLNQFRPARRPLVRTPDLSGAHASLFDTNIRTVLVAPGAAHLNKAWPTERFADVIRGLHRGRDVRFLWVVTGAERREYPSPEFDAGENVMELVDLPLDQLAAVTASSNLVIANDSGVGHLASAVGTPVLSIFGPTHPALGFSPRGLRDELVQVDETCRPCSLHGRKLCYREERFCFTRISADQVVAAAAELLAETSDLKAALFVDRDGTLIQDKHYLADPEGVELIDGAVEALRLAKAGGYSIIVVTNQSGVAKGYHSLEAVEQVNGRMLELLAAEGVQPAGVYFCPHHYRQGKIPEFTVDCNCRKPSPGMVETAALDLGLDLRRSIVVGDSLVDVNLGRVMGGRSILVRTGYGASVETEAGDRLNRAGVSIVADLSQAVRLLPDRSGV
jgi:histidinol-phosphate phosphatase family protein